MSPAASGPPIRRGPGPPLLSPPKTHGPAVGPEPMGRPRPPPRAAPLPRPARVPTHLQHELTLVSPHEDELSREPVAGAAAAHQEPRGDTHLGAQEARPALGVGGVIREGAPLPRPQPLGTLKARSEPALLGLKHLHGATTAAAFRKAGLQASPSRTMPVLHRPPPRLRSPLCSGSMCTLFSVWVPEPRREVVLWCPRSWGQMWSGGWGGDPCLLPRDVSPPAQVHRHTHATHACAQLPNTLGAPPTSSRATLLERACAHAGTIPGSGGRTLSPHRGASFQPVGRRQGGEQLVQRSQRHRETRALAALGGVHPRPGVGKWAREPLGLGSRQGDGPRPRCWVMRAWESRGWPRSGADALEGPGLAGTLGAKSRVKRSRPVPKSRRSSGQGEQLHPAQGLSTRRTPARPALEVPGP